MIGGCKCERYHGWIFRRWAIQKEKDFAQYVSDYANLLTGTIKIGGSSLFSSFMLPKLIAEFNKAYPKIKFKIYEDNTKNLLNKLNEGRLDIVIDNAETSDDGIVSTVYSSEHILLAVPRAFRINEELKKFRLSAQDIIDDKHHNSIVAVNLDRFKSLPFIILNPENDTGKRANKLFKKHNITPNVSFTLDQQVTAYNISSSGLGISFVSDTLIKHIDSTPELYFYRLSDKETTRNICFYTRNNRYLSLSCTKLIKHHTPNS